MKINVERITVGDYAFVYKKKVIVIVERKTLEDLASSIKDGRMDNNNKLLEAQKKHGCQILYIIEGSAYPNMERKFGRMPYKCLQGKLDSLLFRYNIKIIWTRDCEHTAKRLLGLSVKFTDLAKDGVFGEFSDEKIDVDGGVQNVIKIKHTVNIDQVHIKMIMALGVSYKTAMSAMQKYNIIQLLMGQTDKVICYNLVYIDSGFRLGSRGEKLHNLCKRLETLPLIQQKVLACMNGITIKKAEVILSAVKFSDIVSSSFKDGDVANIYNNKRKIGKAIEGRIKMIFKEHLSKDLL